VCFFLSTGARSLVPHVHVAVTYCLYCWLAYVLYVVAYVKAVEIVLKEMFNSVDLSLAFITFAVLLY